MASDPTANSRSITDKRLANLKPWKPGQSGNPKGRPKRHDAVKPLLDQFGPEAIKKLVMLMDSEDERIAYMAAKEVADRAFGKPKISQDDADDQRALTINIIRYADGDQPPEQLDAPTVSVRTLAIPGAGR